MTVVATVTVGALAGCGAGSSSSPERNSRELALERTQFEQVSRQLSALEGQVKREVSASRAVWPSLADGLGGVFTGGGGIAVGIANARAKALPEPAFLADASRLSGPAAGIASIYENYEQLAQQGWTQTDAALRTISAAGAAVSGSRAAGPAGGATVSVARAAGQATETAGTRPSAAQASFERANSPLYIDAIYDAHFDLSLLGKGLVSGYKKLGGAQAFGPTLTQAEVNALAGAYSIPAVRLEPHPAGPAKGG